jgi:hypothetical protein
MSEYEVKKIDEMEAVYGGAFKRARAELGVSSFGMSIIDLPPSYEHYPEHDHAEDGQEEVFFALKGGGEIEIEGQRFPLDGEHVARVASGTKRKIWPGPDGVRLLALGGVPGGDYVPPEMSKLGQPDPLAAS